MIAIMKMSGKFYGRDLSLMDEDEINEYLEDFTSQGTPVTLVKYIEEACELFEIELKDIEIV